MSSHSLAYGKTTISYELLTADRKTVEIAVHPDKSVIVKAPPNTPPELIGARIRKRARWISRQIAYFDQFHPRTPAREYVGGETHLYLGRQYRLKISSAIADKVTLRKGFFYIECRVPDAVRVRRLLEDWYQKRAAAVFSELLADCWQKFDGKGYDKPALRIQSMRKRWGSLSVSGRLTLNTDLIRAPKECIKYVILHELCHLEHYHHGAEFYKTLDGVSPDRIKLKHKLEMALL